MLNESFKRKIASNLTNSILLNDEIIKLVFGPEDVPLIAHHLNIRDELKSHRKYLIDIQELYKPFNNGNQISLKKLVEITCNQQLDKRETLSRWKNRPLREGQMKYAAIDAYILLDIYDRFKNKHQIQQTF
jgi:ribonuclease D